jgi:hypothetical protein
VLHTELRAGIPHLLVIKWFVPDGVEVAGDGGLAPVEKIKGFIAFSIFGLGSFLHISKTMLYFESSIKVLAVTCTHRSWYNAASGYFETPPSVKKNLRTPHSDAKKYHRIEDTVPGRVDIFHADGTPSPRHQKNETQNLITSCSKRQTTNPP